MRAVIQRVTRASVTIDRKVEGKIDSGLLILLGIVPTDTMEDINWLCRKITNLRIFNDDAGVMNKSVKDIGGGLLVISQFTLYASTKKGNRPSYIRAAKPDIAVPLYELFLERLSIIGEREVARGIFGADMKVDLLNDGPVTIIIDTNQKE